MPIGKEGHGRAAQRLKVRVARPEGAKNLLRSADVEVCVAELMRLRSSIAATRT
jgi:hypothetical protein